jgi:hypothetical protein
MTVRVTREAEPQLELYGAVTGELLGSGLNYRSSTTFTAANDYLIVVPKNDVVRAQVELGQTVSGSIVTTTSTVTRAAETLTIAAAAAGTVVAGAHDMLITYADEGTAAQQTIFDRRVDANNRITVTLDTDGAKTGTITLTMVNAASSATATASAELTPGVEVPANVAWRVTASEIQVALNGTAGGATATAIGIPDLSAADVDLSGIMGYRTKDCLWSQDIGATGIAEASA